MTRANFTRQRLPNRRGSVTRQAGGLNCTATAGRFDDGSLGKLFPEGHKASSTTGIVVSDAAFALQFGWHLEALPKALCRGRSTARRCARHTRGQGWRTRPLKMPRRPATYTQTDVAHAIRAAKQADALEIEVRLDKKCVIVRLTRNPQRQDPRPLIQPISGPRPAGYGAAGGTETATGRGEVAEPAQRDKQRGERPPDKREALVSRGIGRASRGRARLEGATFKHGFRWPHDKSH